jgi:uncharacterized membrane protein YdbT with pleckstrin-like domain
MSQQDNPDQAKTPAEKSAQPFQETVIFDGSAAKVGRFGAFVATFIIAALLIVIPIGLKVWTTVAVAWWVTAGSLILAIILVMGQFAYHNTIRYRITNYRVDYERGILTRRIDSLELWRVDDLQFRQTLMERIMGVGTIEVFCRERQAMQDMPISIPNARKVFESIKSSILIAKRQRGILEVDQ